MTLDENRRKNMYSACENGLALFVKEGVNSISFKDVAEATNLTQRSLFRYFDDKDDLVRSTFEIFAGKVSEKTKELVCTASYADKTGICQIEELIEFYMDMIVREPNETKYMLEAGMTIDISHFCPGINGFDSYDDEEDAASAPLLKAFRKGLEDGSINREKNPSQTYLLISDALLGLMLRLILAPASIETIDAERRKDALLSLLK